LTRENRLETASPNQSDILHSMASNKNFTMKPVTLGAIARKALDHFVEQVDTLTANQPDDEYDEQDIVFNLIQCDDDGLKAYGLDSMVWYRTREQDLPLLFKAITDLYSHDTLLELCRDGRWIDNEDDDAFHLHPSPYHNRNYDAILIEGILQFMRETIFH